VNETERAVLAAWGEGWTVTYTRFRLGLSKRQMRAVLLRLGLLTPRARPGLEQRCWPETREGRRRWRARGSTGEAQMEAARDEARARIAARLARDTRRGAPVAREGAEAVTGAFAPVVHGGAERASDEAGTFVERAVRRLEARAAALEAWAPHRTPRPGAGRAPTTAG
jgi:hypothetical protein